MGDGGILSNTFSLFRKQFQTYIGLVAICFVISFIGLLVPDALEFIGPLAEIIGSITAVILTLVIHSIMYGGLAKIASEQLVGRKIGVGEAWRAAIGNAWVLIITALLNWVLGIAGLLLFIIPGIYILVSLALVNQAIIVENARPVDALKRSYSLIKGSWWRCFVVFLQVFIIQLVLTHLVGEVSGQTLLDVERSSGELKITQIGVSFLVGPIWVIATTLLFYDLRDRKNKLELPSVADSLTENNNSTVSEQ